jgi:magnesium transporter
MSNELLLPEIKEFLEAKDYKALEEFCVASHPVDMADYFSALSPSEIWDIVSHINPNVGVEIFCHLDLDLQLKVTQNLKREEFARLLTDLPSDDRVDLVKRIPNEKMEAILPALAHAEREDIRRLVSHKEGTAGAIMTSDYAVIPKEATVQQALANLRHEAPDKETIFSAFVTDEERKLIGMISLKDLILAHPDTLVKDIMQRETIEVEVDADREDAARMIQRYDMLALPVVDANSRLVGIITHDDALDVLTQEYTEDMERLMAISGSHDEGAYMKTSVYTHFKNRAGWIVSLSILGLVAGSIIHSYEELLTQMMILALYMPMIADTGGNVGSQSATVIIRALALKEITPKDVFSVAAKEFKVSIMLSVTLFVVTMLKVIYLSKGIVLPDGQSLTLIGLAISIALALQVVSSALIGTFLPMGVAWFKLDPALVASPALTTLVDATGLIIYFNIVKMMLSSYVG